MKGQEAVALSCALASVLAGALLACVSKPAEIASRPVQGWWHENGMVVPHDTFPADCSLCHTSASWHELAPTFVFDHGRETGVPLEGAHARAECLRCHNDRGPVAVFAQQGCAGCHEDVHRGELGRDCAACHDQRDWRPDEVIALHARTRLPLVGAHATTACWRCHAGAQIGNFRNVDPECVTCHLTDYRATSDPDHEAQGLSTSCQDCHGFLAWSGGLFSHAGIQSGCVACHLADYQATSDPDHEAMGFPTDCQTCHAPTEWSQAHFEHDFPITGGPHAVDCARCHVVPSNPTVFSCVVCHAHEQSEMQDEHDDVSGFVWESNACYACHPDGRE